jgi:hypothetical protein
MAHTTGLNIAQASVSGSFGGHIFPKPHILSYLTFSRDDAQHLFLYHPSPALTHMP